MPAEISHSDIDGEEIMTSQDGIDVEGEDIARGRDPLQAWLKTLRQLDCIIARALRSAATGSSAETTWNAFRGLTISASDVVQLLERSPAASLLGGVGSDVVAELVNPLVEDERVHWLRATYQLDDFDIAVIVVAIAPELDTRYERLYGFLQDDVTKKYPTVDLCLNLLCSSPQIRIELRTRFSADALLTRHRLVATVQNPHKTDSWLLGQALRVDPQIIDVLLGQGGLDRRLVSFCRNVLPCNSRVESLISGDSWQRLESLLRQSTSNRAPLRLFFHGPRGAGKRQVAEALAATLGCPLLYADLSRLLSSDIDFMQALHVTFREAWLQGSILYWDELDALRTSDRADLYRLLLEQLAEHGGVAILSGTLPWTPHKSVQIGMIEFNFPVLDVGERARCWQICLARVGTALSAPDVDTLAGRFRMTPGEISDAVATAQNLAGSRAIGEDPPTILLSDLFTAARAQSGHELAALTRKIERVYTWDDIVLPDDSIAQLRELCARVTHGPRVLGEWGFGRKLSQGKGTNALFAGPSGTGKTMAAEIIANELGLDLYKIDLAGIVSKYIGETEKNLDRIFAAAENANAILFFDEADALFGKRSEVRDSHDRYANIEISYLLQKMEQYEGVAILATNLRQNLDEAFVRRLAFTVHFPFPSEIDRLRIWTSIWPGDTPLVDGLDLGFLSREFKLAGGNIKNIALGAAFFAASDGGVVTMDHLLRATRREFQKMGKTLSEAELSGHMVVTQEGKAA